MEMGKDVVSDPSVQSSNLANQLVDNSLLNFLDILYIRLIIGRKPYTLLSVVFASLSVCRVSQMPTLTPLNSRRNPMQRFNKVIAAICAALCLILMLLLITPTKPASAAKPSAKFNAIENAATGDEAKALWYGLTSEEKAGFAAVRLERILTLDLTPDQRKFVIEAQASISKVTSFDNQTAMSKMRAERDWTSQAKELFGPKKALAYFASRTWAAGLLTVQCDCNWNQSNWCGECCIPNTCDGSADGCGFLLLYPCNGQCMKCPD